MNNKSYKNICLFILFFSILALTPFTSSQEHKKEPDKQMRSGLMYAIIKSSNDGEALFKKSGMGKNGKSCKSCHSKKEFPQLIGKKVNNYTSSAIQYCYGKKMGDEGVIPEKDLNNILIYLLTLRER